MYDLCFQLLEACITLYPANADGTPQLDNPIWFGAEAENLRAMERWIKKRTTPTGAPYPNHHPLVPEYELTINRVWVEQLTTSGPQGWNVSNQQYVLDIVWTDQETYQWQRRTFYGVTINQRSLDAQDVEHGFIEGQIFDAQYMVTASGLPETSPPIISPTLPYPVNYTDATGTVALYSYDATSGLFTAQASTDGRATIITEPAFAIQFAVDDEPVVQVTSGASMAYRNGNAYRNAFSFRQNALQCAGIFAKVPSPADLPRLDFYYGLRRIFSVTRCGIFEVDFVESTVSESVPAGSFGVYGGNDALVGIFGPSNVTACQFVVPVP